MTDLRRLGRSDLETPPLVLGGNVFGWTADEATSFRILDAFVDGGGRMIDTADVYSSWVDGHRGGESEAVIGRWLKRSGKRDRVLIATKVGMLAGEGGALLQPARIAAAAEASLGRLWVEAIDLYYAHQDDAGTPQEEVLHAFSRLVDAGKVRVLGASNFSAERLASALDLAEREGAPRYEVLQPEYNLVARDFETDLQPLCVAREVAALPYFGLAAGFLTGKYRRTEDAAGARGGQVRRAINRGGLDLLPVLDGVAEEAGASPAQVALAWLAAKPGVAAPIASATSVEQLEELLGAMRLALTAEQVARLDGAIKA